MFSLDVWTAQSSHRHPQTPPTPGVGSRRTPTAAKKFSAAFIGFSFAPSVDRRMDIGASPYALRLTPRNNAAQRPQVQSPAKFKKEGEKKTQEEQKLAFTLQGFVHQR